MSNNRIVSFAYFVKKYVPIHLQKTVARGSVVDVYNKFIKMCYYCNRYVCVYNEDKFGKNICQPCHNVEALVKPNVKKQFDREQKKVFNTFKEKTSKRHKRISIWVEKQLNKCIIDVKPSDEKIEQETENNNNNNTAVEDIVVNNKKRNLDDDSNDDDGGETSNKKHCSQSFDKLFDRLTTDFRWYC